MENKNSKWNPGATQDLPAFNPHMIQTLLRKGAQLVHTGRCGLNHYTALIRFGKNDPWSYREGDTQEYRFIHFEWDKSDGWYAATRYSSNHVGSVTKSYLKEFWDMVGMNKRIEKNREKRLQKEAQ